MNTKCESVVEMNKTASEAMKIKLDNKLPDYPSFKEEDRKSVV